MIFVLKFAPPVIAMSSLLIIAWRLNINIRRLEDCRKVVAHLTEEYPTLLVGDSAGAWLTAMISHEMGYVDGASPDLPHVGRRFYQGSYVTQAKAPM